MNDQSSLSDLSSKSVTAEVSLMSDKHDDIESL